LVSSIFVIHSNNLQKKIPHLTITHTESPDEIFQLPKRWSGVTYSFWIHSNCKSEISNSLQSTDVATWDKLIQTAKGTIEEYEGIDSLHPITAPCDILRYLAEVIPEISSKLIVICGHSTLAIPLCVDLYRDFSPHFAFICDQQNLKFAQQYVLNKLKQMWLDWQDDQHHSYLFKLWTMLTVQSMAIKKWKLADISNFKLVLEYDVPSFEFKKPPKDSNILKITGDIWSDAKSESSESNNNYKEDSEEEKQNESADDFIEIEKDDVESENVVKEQEKEQEKGKRGRGRPRGSRTTRGRGRGSKRKAPETPQLESRRKRRKN